MEAQFDATDSWEDWKVIRDCFVESFLDYKLYEYYVSDQKTRRNFLRKYLDVNYGLLREHGLGLLLALRARTTDGEKIIIGGSLFALHFRSSEPGLVSLDVENFIEAYRESGLAEISALGFERLCRYERWEQTVISGPDSRPSANVWNGFFCAIFPRYRCKGLGSKSYQQAKDILYRSVPVNLPSPRKVLGRSSSAMNNGGTKLSEARAEESFLLVITHCHSSAEFHKRNGLVPQHQLRYEDPQALLSFTVYVLNTELQPLKITNDDA